MTVVCRVISTYLRSLITGVANAVSPLLDSTEARHMAVSGSPTGP
jgi:hypothetical protein